MIPRVIKGVKLTKACDILTVYKNTPDKSTTIMITRLQRLFALAIFLLCFSQAGLSHPEVTARQLNASTTNSGTGSIFDALVREDAIEITIETDLVELIDNRKREDYQKAKVTFENSQGADQELEVKVKPRGKFRRRVCDFPPVMIKFPKDELALNGYNREYNKLKLVSHCIDEKSAGKEVVLKEYLVYQMYAALTNQSYRVQLAEITYVDSKKKLSKITRYGFVIEDTDEMAARLGGIECDCLNAEPSRINAAAENKMAVFQYLIGNEDWGIPMLRNLKMVQPIDGSPLIPVPYDFDFAGMVDAPYAIPNTDLNLRSIKDRVYLGNPIGDNEMSAMLRFFIKNRSMLEAKIDGFKTMKRSSRKEMLDYLDSFYANIDQVTQQAPVNLQAYLKNNPYQANPVVVPVEGK